MRQRCTKEGKRSHRFRFMVVPVRVSEVVVEFMSYTGRLRVVLTFTAPKLVGTLCVDSTDPFANCIIFLLDPSANVATYHSSRLRSLSSGALPQRRQLPIQPHRAGWAAAPCRPAPPTAASADHGAVQYGSDGHRTATSGRPTATASTAARTAASVSTGAAVAAANCDADSARCAAAVYVLCQRKLPRWRQMPVQPCSCGAAAAECRPSTVLGRIATAATTRVVASAAAFCAAAGSCARCRSAS